MLPRKCKLCIDPEENIKWKKCGVYECRDIRETYKPQVGLPGMFKDNRKKKDEESS